MGQRCLCRRVVAVLGWWEGRLWLWCLCLGRGLGATCLNRIINQSAKMQDQLCHGQPTQAIHTRLLIILTTKPHVVVVVDFPTHKLRLDAPVCITRVFIVDRSSLLCPASLINAHVSRRELERGIKVPRPEGGSRTAMYLWGTVCRRF